MPFCVVAMEVPTSQPSSCSHISARSFVCLAYTGALEQGSTLEGELLYVDANLLLIPNLLNDFPTVASHTVNI